MTRTFLPTSELVERVAIVKGNLTEAAVEKKLRHKATRQLVYKAACCLSYSVRNDWVSVRRARECTIYDESLLPPWPTGWAAI